MVITEVEPLSRTRYKVYIDGKFAFVLYKGDLARYHLARGCEIPEETCRQIRREVVLKRAKMRALHLLNDMGRTESQLRAKLRQNHYTEEIIEELCMYRVTPVTILAMPEAVQERVKKAVCAQIEYLDANGGSDLDNGAGLQSASLGKFSYTLAAGAGTGGSSGCSAR